MQDKLPRSPFATPLSGSAKETELRLRSIFQWKKKRPPALLVILSALTVLLCCGLVSCQPAQEPVAPEKLAQDIPAVSPAPRAETRTEEKAPVQVMSTSPEEWRKTAEGAAALDAYRAVLLGEATYFDTFSGEDLAVGQPSSQAGGTFSFSSGAYDHGWGTISFAGDSCSVDQVTYCASSYDSDTKYLSERYVVDHKDASADEFEAALARQLAKPDASWYDFTENNINAAFSGGETPWSGNETFCYDLYTADGVLELIFQESRVWDDLSCRRVEQIRVYQGDVLLQTIDTASLTYDGDWLYEGLFVNPGYTVGEPDIRDVNFDGSTDFGLLTAAVCPRNVPYGYFLWDSETKQFTFSFVLCSYLTVDKTRQQLTEQIVEGPAGSYDRYNTYEFDADGQLTLVGSEIVYR